MKSLPSYAWQPNENFPSTQETREKNRGYKLVWLRSSKSSSRSCLYLWIPVIVLAQVITVHTCFLAISPPSMLFGGGFLCDDKCPSVRRIQKVPLLGAIQERYLLIPSSACLLRRYQLYHEVCKCSYVKVTRHQLSSYLIQRSVPESSLYQHTSTVQRGNLFVEVISLNTSFT